jgi:NAD-dependent deacetylase
VAFTGAGVSTECGIPDFRSPGGLWTRFRPIAFDEFLASAETRKEAWSRFFAIHDAFAGAAPGSSHRAIAELHRRGHVAGVITQNVDDLHARSGVPRERIVELHGNGTYARCLDCGERHELPWVRRHLAKNGWPPACRACGGIVKAATVSFGQAMPEEAMAAAYALTLDADLFIALGSSLQVFPAAGLPAMAKESGAALVIVNREATDLDGLADLVIHDEIAAVLTGVVARLAG